MRVHRFSVSKSCKVSASGLFKDTKDLLVPMNAQSKQEVTLEQLQNSSMTQNVFFGEAIEQLWSIMEKEQIRCRKQSTYTQIK